MYRRIRNHNAVLLLLIGLSLSAIESAAAETSAASTEASAAFLDYSKMTVQPEGPIGSCRVSIYGVDSISYTDPLGGRIDDGYLIDGVRSVSGSFYDLNEAGRRVPYITKLLWFGSGNRTKQLHAILGIPTYEEPTRTMEYAEYGTVELIQMLEIVSCVVESRYGAKLRVGDRSHPYFGHITYKTPAKAHPELGGISPEDWWATEDNTVRYQFARHVSHQTGKEADLGYYYFDYYQGVVKNDVGNFACGASQCPDPGTDTPLSSVPSKAFRQKESLAANWLMLTTADRTFPLSAVGFDKYLIRELHIFACRINFSDSKIRKFFGGGCIDIPETLGELNDAYAGGSGLLVHLPDHADHYHLTIRCPAGDSAYCGGPVSSHNSVDFRVLEKHNIPVSLVGGRGAPCGFRMPCATGFICKHSLSGFRCEEDCGGQGNCAPGSTCLDSVCVNNCKNACAWDNPDCFGVCGDM